MQPLARKRRFWLSDRGLKERQVSQSRLAAIALDLITVNLDHFSKGQEDRICHLTNYSASALSVLLCRRFTASSAERNLRSRRALATGEMIRFRPSVAISSGVSMLIFKRSSTGLSIISAALFP